MPPAGKSKSRVYLGKIWLKKTKKKKKTQKELAI